VYNVWKEVDLASIDPTSRAYRTEHNHWRAHGHWHLLDWITYIEGVAIAYIVPFVDHVDQIVDEDQPIVAYIGAFDQAAYDWRRELELTTIFDPFDDIEHRQSISNGYKFLMDCKLFAVALHTFICLCDFEDDEVPILATWRDYWGGDYLNATDELR
jgi:hypothetical protein